MTTPEAVHHPKAVKAGALHRDIGVLVEGAIEFEFDGADGGVLEGGGDVLCAEECGRGLAAGGAFFDCA